ncbi:hypothetical protein [Tenacibaculum sp. 190524A05c]|uniref:hypothetical protein n=1 Tax=Tenacibaculum platacis TaxID=3137852 RepID=UPI0032B18D85
MKLNYKTYNKKRNIYYTITSIIGMSLCVWIIELYQKTFVELYILFVIVLGVGLIATLIDFKYYKKTYSLKGFSSIFFAFLTNLSIWGFTTCALFMTSNYYFEKSKSRFKTYEIIDRYSIIGSKRNRSESTPVFQILHKVKIKDIYFGNDFYKDMNSFKNIELEIKQGFWKFDILINKKLKK